MADRPNVRDYYNSMKKLEQLEHEEEGWYDPVYTWQEMAVLVFGSITVLTVIVGVCVIWK